MLDKEIRFHFVPCVAMICLPESCQSFHVRNHHLILKVKKYTRRSQVHCLRIHTQWMSVRDRLGSYLPLYQSSGFSSHFMMLSSVKGKVRRQTLLDVTVSDYRNCKHVKNGEKEKKWKKGQEERGEEEEKRCTLPLTLIDHYCLPRETYHSSSHFILTRRTSSEVEQLFSSFFRW